MLMVVPWEGWWHVVLGRAGVTGLVILPMESKSGVMSTYLRVGASGDRGGAVGEKVHDGVSDIGVGRAEGYC